MGLGSSLRTEQSHAITPPLPLAASGNHWWCHHTSGSPRGSPSNGDVATRSATSRCVRYRAMALLSVSHSSPFGPSRSSELCEASRRLAPLWRLHHARASPGRRSRSGSVASSIAWWLSPGSRCRRTATSLAIQRSSSCSSSSSTVDPVSEVTPSQSLQTQKVGSEARRCCGIARKGAPPVEFCPCRGVPVARLHPRSGGDSDWLKLSLMNWE